MGGSEEFQACRIALLLAGRGFVCKLTQQSNELLLVCSGSVSRAGCYVVVKGFCKF